MALLFITAISPGNIEFWVEDAVAGPPVFAAAKDSIVMNTADGKLYNNTNGGVSWVQILQNPIDLAVVVTDAADGAIGAGLWLRKTFAAADGNLDVVLPVRTGGWRVIDAYIISNGAGGSLQVQTTAAVAITDAMARGAANAITRAAGLDRVAGIIGSAGSVRFTTAGGGAFTGEAFVRIEPL